MPRTISLTPVEFVSFKKVANYLSIMFQYFIEDNVVNIEADNADLLVMGY